jgi:hypothetical protein
LVQAWSTCPSCGHWSTLCVRLCVQGHSVCSHGNAGLWHAPALCCCVRGLCWCSLGNSDIGDAGAVAIGAGLAHLPQLQTLGYVVCPTVCAWSWRVLARERRAMACACAVLLCVRFVFVQPIQQRYWWRWCGGHRCRPVPPAPAADTEVRFVSDCVCGAVVYACTGTHGNCAAVVCVCVCGLCLAAFSATQSVTQGRRPLVQAWPTCPSCRHFGTLCARL